MSETATIPQDEARTISAGCKVTKAEKDALRVVAAFDETTESDLLRDCTMADVLRRADEIRTLREHMRKGVEPAGDAA
jgi:hypothetical protein